MTEKVNLNPVIAILLRFTHVENILLGATFTEDAFNAGKEVNVEHPENIPPILTADAKLNNGTVANELQALNIAFVPVVTAVVLNSGTDVNAVQPENILPIVVTDAVLNKGTVVNAVQPENIPSIAVTAAVLNSGTDVKFLQALNILVVVVTLLEDDDILTFLKFTQPLNIYA